MSEPEGKYSMRFIGKPEGKLLRGAPGNYVHGQVYQMSFNNSKFKFWELVEPLPVLVVPEDGDSIYDESIHVPDEISEYVEPVTHPEEVNVDPKTEATIEPYMNFNTTTGVLTPHNVTTTDEVSVEEAKPEPTRDELKTVLDEAGVVYKSSSRTTTLQRLVDELVSEE